MNARFARGRFYAISGENGAGKSTLLRLIAGLTRPTTGKISLSLQGEQHSSKQDAPSEDQRAHIGFMGHASLLYDEMSALENLVFFAGLYPGKETTNQVRAQACREAILSVGLDPALRRRVRDYSQGMRQRLSLARAIVHSPSLLLLDEPFANVDGPSIAHMGKLLGAMRDAAGKTILLVTHQPRGVAGWADEHLVITSGRLLANQPALGDRDLDHAAPPGRELAR